MSKLYIDCQMGVAGDMVLASLLDLVDDKNLILQQLRSAGIPGLCVSDEDLEIDGVKGKRVTIVTEEESGQHGRLLSEVCQIIEGLAISQKAKDDAKGVYKIIAEAEAVVHETDVEHVHFHEVGNLSAIADIVGTSLVMEALSPDETIVSSIHVGSGTVICAHGELSVPTPATKAILEGLPTYGGEIKGELCTPTGAALIKYFADRFGLCPEMSAPICGRGFGTKIFSNCMNGLCVKLG